MLPNNDKKYARGKRLLAAIKNFILPPQPEGQVPSEDAAYMPSRLAALFLRPPQATFMIVRCTFVLVVIFILWALIFQLDETTNGEGKVIPSSQIQVIQNLEGGIVSNIPVRIGSVVQKDQVVLQLDEKRFASSVGESKAKMDAQFAKIARLTAESTGQDFAVDEKFEKENPKVVMEERALYESRKRELTATLSEKRARMTHLQTSYELSRKELNMTRPLAEKGVVSQVELLRLERTVTDLRREMDSARISIDAIHAKFKADAANELAQVRMDYASLSASGVAADDRLARTTVRSPVHGIVKSIKVNTVGGVIQPGMDVMEIVPLEDNLLIEVRVRPSDVGFLRVGQPALVRVSAYDYAIYGGLDALVENITADSITNDKGESFYLVRVRTTKNYLGTEDNKLSIIPGMLTTASIKTGSKSVMSYLLKPIFKAKQEALSER